MVYFRGCYLKNTITFPEPPQTLVPDDGPVGLSGAAVSLHGAALKQPDLSLEPDLHHVGGLSESHRHRSRRAARQQTSPESSICRTRIFAEDTATRCIVHFSHFWNPWTTVKGNKILVGKVKLKPKPERNLTLSFPPGELKPVLSL